MNLGVTLRAIGVEGRALQRLRNSVRIVTVMTVMAAQTEHYRRLAQQLLGHGAVRIVADHAILRHWRMFVHKRSLLRRVTLEAG